MFSLARTERLHLNQVLTLCIFVVLGTFLKSAPTVCHFFLSFLSRQDNKIAFDGRSERNSDFLTKSISSAKLDKNSSYETFLQ